MKIRLIEDNRSQIWPSRYGGFWSAAALSVIGHGVLLYGLSNGVSRASPPENRVVNEVALIRLNPDSMLASYVAALDVPKQALPDLPKTQNEGSELLGQKGTHVTKGFSPVESERVPSARTLLYVSPDNEELQSEPRCFGKRMQDIPDEGQSNRLGRREEEDPCEQG